MQDYEKLQHKLGSPTLSVHSETFLPLLSKIDESIALLIQHPHYKVKSIGTYLPPPFLFKIDEFNAF